MCLKRVLFPVILVVRVPRRGAQDGTLDAAVDHRELKLRPGTCSLGVSSCPQHRSGTAPPGGRPPEAVSPVTLAQRRTRTRYTALSLSLSNKPFAEPGNHGKKSFQRRKSQRRQRQRQERWKREDKKQPAVEQHDPAQVNTFDEILKDSTARTFMTANHHERKSMLAFSMRDMHARLQKASRMCWVRYAAGIGYDACQMSSVTCLSSASRSS